MLHKRKGVPPTASEDEQVATTPPQPLHEERGPSPRSAPRSAGGLKDLLIFIFLLALLLVLLILLALSLFYLTSAVHDQIDFQFSDWVFSSSQEQLQCSNENIRDRVLLGNTLMYRYTADHLGVADDWRGVLERKAKGSYEEERGARNFHQYSCDWVSVRLNIGDYGASKPTPVVSGHWVYIGTDKGTLLKLSRTDGKVVADYKCRDSVKGIHGSPAVDETNVYIGAYDGYLYAINKDSLSLSWDIRLGSWIGASPTLYGNTIYVGVEVSGPSGYLCGVDRRTGKEVFRSKRLGDYCHSTPTVDLETGLIYMGDNSGTLSCWDLNTHTTATTTTTDTEKEKEKGLLPTETTSAANHGAVRLDVEPKWVFTMGKNGDVKSTPAVYGDLVYITSWNRYLYALDKRTGAEVWKFGFDKGSMSSPSVDPVRGLVIVGSFDRYVYCLDSKTGHLKWKVSTDGGIMSSATILSEQGIAIIGGGRRDVFVASTPENNSIMENSPGKPGVYIIDLETGDVLQILYLRARLTGAPVIVGPFIYVFDHFGYLYSFSQQTDKEK